MSQQNILGVAVTQWNQSALTVKLLDTLVSIKQIMYIVLVDNGSEDKELFALREYLEKIKRSNLGITVHLIENAVNSGFSVGSNLAISKLLSLGCDWIWLLNNDCEPKVIKPKGFQELIDHAEPAIYGSHIRTGKGSQFTGFYKFNFLLASHTEIQQKHEFDEIDSSKKYVCGANMMIHKEVFAAVGLLNNRTFLYYEELDFVNRATKYGFSQRLSLDFKVFHHEAGSATGSYTTWYSEVWSNLDFYKTHKPRLFLIMLLLRCPVKALLNLIFLRKEKSLAITSATLNFISGNNVLMKEPKIQ